MAAGYAPRSRACLRLQLCPAPVRCWLLRVVFRSDVVKGVNATLLQTVAVLGGLGGFASGVQAVAAGCARIRKKARPRRRYRGRHAARGAAPGGVAPGADLGAAAAEIGRHAPPAEQRATTAEAARPR